MSVLSFLYISLCKIIKFIVKDTFVQYVEPEWKPITITYKTKYYGLDYTTKLNTFTAWLLQILTPSYDNTQRKKLNEWSILSQYSIGKDLPAERETIESLEDSLWNKTNSFFLKNNGDYWIADFSYMESYEVRPGFYKYGGKIFMQEGKIIKVEYQNNTYEEVTYWLDQVLRSTLSIALVIDMHLSKVHLMTAQNFSVKWYNEIPADDPRVPLLKVLTFGTFAINRAIGTIFPVVSNLTAFTPDAFNKYIDDRYAKGPMTMNEIMGTVGTAWNKKMIEYRSHVDEFLTELGLIKVEDDEDPTYLRTFFLTVTAGHDQFGDCTIDNLVVSYNFPPKVEKDKEGTLTELEVEQLRLIAYLVSPKPPRFAQEAWIKTFPEDKKEACEKFRNYMENHEPNWFNPALFEISVAN